MRLSTFSIALFALSGAVVLLDGVAPGPRPVSESDVADAPSPAAPALASPPTADRGSDGPRRTEALLSARVPKPSSPPADEADDETEELIPSRHLRERALASLILSALRQDDRSALRDLLSDPELRARVPSLTVRIAEGHDAAEAADVLARAATDEDAALREFGLRNLAGVGFPTPAVRAAVEAGLRSADAATRALAVAALDGGREARPYALGAATDPEPEVRRVALAALGRARSDRSDAVAALARGLEDPDSEVRAGAARSLGRMGRGAAAALPALERARSDPVPAVASLASRAAAAVLEP